MIERDPETEAFIKAMDLPRRVPPRKKNVGGQAPGFERKFFAGTTYRGDPHWHSLTVGMPTPLYHELRNHAEKMNLSFSVLLRKLICGAIESGKFEELVNAGLQSKSLLATSERVR